MATPPDASDLLTYIAAELKVAEVDLPALWTTLCVQGVAQAYDDVVSIMSLKGYPVSTINQWSALNAYVLAQGMYQVGLMGANYADYSDKFVQPQNLCEKDGFLDRFGVVIVDGVAIAAGGSDVGGIRYGTTDIDLRAIQRARVQQAPRWWG